MLSVNTNLYSMNVQNYERLNNINFTQKTERIGSGLRVNRAGDDPSGLAIASGMEAQIQGMVKSIHNAEEGIRFLRFTDGFLETVQDQLQRMRDLTIKLSNEAVNDAVPGDQQNDRYYGSAYETYKEILTIGDHLWKSIRNYNNDLVPSGARVTFNTKEAFQGEYDPGQTLQVGPDNDISHRMNVLIEDLTPVLDDLPVPFDQVSSFDGRMSERDYANFGQNLLQKMDGKIDFISNIRERIGTEDRVLKNVIGDLNAEYINLSAGKSRIIDSDLAQETLDMTRTMILSQSQTAAASQANARPLTVIQLLDAIYDGMTTGSFTQNQPQ